MHPGPRNMHFNLFLPNDTILIDRGQRDPISACESSLSTSGNTLILKESYRMMMIKLKFNYSISWLETVTIFLYRFVSPTCAFQYWAKKSVNTNAFEIAQESSVVECKEMTALLLCIAKAEKLQILSAANICCI